jgi:chorismate dehydratase
LHLDPVPILPRVCAVSYLNTVPLVWGMLHCSDYMSIFDLRFATPSVCADQLASGEADIGIVPVVEMARQGLEYYTATGIACHGPVRSILLVSKVPFRQIRTLATDSGSRTSVMLARVILAERFGATPNVVSRAPDLDAMLSESDAALLIGDAALAVDPATLPFETLDLGGEWVSMTGLPMVFAVWAGRAEAIQKRWERVFLGSYLFGQRHIEDMVRAEAPKRGFPEDLIRRYFTQHIVYQLGERDFEGMRLYLKYALELDRVNSYPKAGSPLPV